MISLACVNVPPKAILNVVECLTTGHIGRGKYIQELEQAFSSYFNVKHAILVANGTIADFIALRCLSELNPGRTEVVMPAFTFVAQANAAIMAGLRPMFVDVDKNYQLDVECAKRAISENTLCVYPAHLLGKFSPCSATEFSINGKRIPIVEDCCEAMGGGINGKKFGTVGDVGTYSMYVSHMITTGEGGLIVTNDDEIAAIARSIHDHGKVGTDFDFKYWGVNAKLTNIQAAIGLEVLKDLDAAVSARVKNVKFLNDELDLDFFAEAPHCFPVLYNLQCERDGAIAHLKNSGIECRKLMSCITRLNPFIYNLRLAGTGELNNATRFHQCGLMVPCHQNMSQDQLRFIADKLKETNYVR